MDVLGVFYKLWSESGFSAFFMDGGWKNLIMILIAFVLLYLGIVKKFEPLLLVGIAFGCLLSNLSYFVALGGGNALYHPELWEAFLDEASPFYHSYGHIMSNAGLLDFFYIGVKAGIYPSLIFMGVGAMTDFGPLIANPKSLLLGAAAQLVLRRDPPRLHRPSSSFHRHHRRCGRPDRDLPHNEARTGAARTHCHRGVFLHGADPADTAAHHEAHDHR